MLNKQLHAITQRIIERSKPTREAYLALSEDARRNKPLRGALSCSNMAHGIAACSTDDKASLSGDTKVNVGIITAYNDMLSAHQPFETYPQFIKTEVAKYGAVAQVAGGVPAMCDGVTQGQPGMELSLFSRDVIAQATAIAMSHNMFDSALYLGVCDKIIPGLLIGALKFGHVPALFAPAGPMASGISNAEKAEARQKYAKGEIDRAALLDSELKSYHSAGTCTFYGTANSNQMLLEFMGLHPPGGTFANPETELRTAITAEISKRATEVTDLGGDYRPISQVIDERSIVNALVGLMATGGSTNHTLHMIAIAKAAGIEINWSDFSDISEIVPLLIQVYPNGKADVNHFDAAGGLGFVIKELSANGLLHTEANAMWGKNMGDYGKEARLIDGNLSFVPSPEQSHDDNIIRKVAQPFDDVGGIRLLAGNLGRAVIKTSAVSKDRRKVVAPAKVFHSQAAFQKAFKDGDLHQDFIAVARFQGPKANGMPELHKLTPPLAVLQDLGYKVGLVTDGRMSGASGKVPAAIHLSPEAADEGAIGKIRDGDLITLDAETGILSVALSDQKLMEREQATNDGTSSEQGMGRELFANMRACVSTAETGASAL